MMKRPTGLIEWQGWELLAQIIQTIDLTIVMIVTTIHPTKWLKHIPKHPFSIPCVSEEISNCFARLQWVLQEDIASLDSHIVLNTR